MQHRVIQQGNMQGMSKRAVARPSWALPRKRGSSSQLGLVTDQTPQLKCNEVLFRRPHAIAYMLPFAWPFLGLNHHKKNALSCALGALWLERVFECFGNCIRILGYKAPLGNLGTCMWILGYKANSVLV